MKERLKYLVKKSDMTFEEEVKALNRRMKCESIGPRTSEEKKRSEENYRYFQECCKKQGVPIW